jgi:glycogen debranching enzyme
MVRIFVPKAIGRLIRKPKLMLPPMLALHTVISKSGNGVYASSDRLFKGAVFGRDSLVVADDLMTLRPQLTRRILLTMARLQGLKHHSENEEEPGKIVHEYRTRVVDGRRLKGVPLEIFDNLSKRWGGTSDSLIYYGSVDNEDFALGTDFDEKGKLRIIKTTTANPASLLNSRFFEELEQSEKETYVSGIVRNIMGTEFLTDAGVRSRGLSEANLIPFWDYHGSYVSWPKETWDVAKGLRRQSFPALSKQLENRLLNVIKKSRGYPEFLYVDPRGRVLGSSSAAHRHTHTLRVKSRNVPESIQAWTVSAIVAILADRRPGFRLRRRKQQEWQTELEKEVLAHIPKVSHLKTAITLNARYPDYPYELTKEHF